VRVLVTGGTGLIGRALVAALRARGDEVVVVSRAAAVAGVVSWDVAIGEVARADAVVHLAGEPISAGRWTRARLQRIRASRVETTAMLAAALEGAARKPQVFVSGSAVGIYGMRTDDTVLDEASPPGHDVLAEIAVAWEAAADAARGVGVRVVHPRTGIVLGKEGGALAKMALPFRLFAGGPLGSGSQWVSWVHLRDEVRALLFAIDRADLSGPMNVVAPEPVSMESLARAIGRTLRRPSWLRVPAFALRASLGDGLARAVLTGQRALPGKLSAAGFVFDYPRIDEALADLL